MATATLTAGCRRLADGSVVLTDPTREAVREAIAEVARRAGYHPVRADRLAARHYRTTYPGVARYGTGDLEGVSYLYVTGGDGSETWRFFPRPRRDVLVPLLAAAIAAGDDRSEGSILWTRPAGRPDVTR
jgi:hypothetical protein